jgi:hypothetical protein
MSGLLDLMLFGPLCIGSQIEVVSMSLDSFQNNYFFNKLRCFVWFMEKENEMKQKIELNKIESKNFIFFKFSTFSF